MSDPAFGGEEDEAADEGFERVDPSYCFSPPAEPCQCWCMHCHRTFSSSRIWLQREIPRRGDPHPTGGFWMCPTHNCDGAGFGFDLFPTDPAHPANEGWTYDDDEPDDEFLDTDDDNESDAEKKPEPESAAAAYDPAEPGYAAMDALDPDDGDQWKLTEADRDAARVRTAAAEAAEAAAAEQEAEESRRYDAPDERPRVIDHSNEIYVAPPRFVGDDDMPF